MSGVFIISLPSMIVAFLSFLLDMVFYYLFSVLFCIITCGWKRYCNNMSVIAPYKGGPWVVCHLSDVYTGLIGQVGRHGLFAATGMLTQTIILVPWMKYF